MIDPDDEEFSPDEEVSEKSLSQQIDIWLAESRPERYEAGEKDWMDSAINLTVRELREKTTAQGALRELARRRVHMREGMATKTANRILREIGVTGQLPLWWAGTGDWKAIHFEQLHLPISVDRHHRIRFGVANAEDWQQWLLESARQSDKTAAAAAEAREGAHRIVALLTEQGARRTEDIATVTGEDA